MEMSRLTRDGTAEPVSRDHILRREWGQGKKHFPCSADHEQDWQPYPVGPYALAVCNDHTYIPYIHTYIHACILCGTQSNIRSTQIHGIEEGVSFPRTKNQLKLLYYSTLTLTIRRTPSYNTEQYSTIPYPIRRFGCVGHFRGPDRCSKSQ